MSHLIEVAFRGNRKEFFTWEDDLVPSLKTAVIVEADRGEDLGRVHATGELAAHRCKGCSHGCGSDLPSRRALRIATREDIRIDEEHTALNEQARRSAMERVKANGLVMKLTDAEWQWDKRKLTIFFTSEKRVDFRTLVRDLAALFKTRIELKQIGVRDEAKRLDGVGRSGRRYCSASWLPELRPVNLGVAKDQHLSLNPQQISGACGRLMCCLRYEHDFYVESRRRFPKEGRILVTARGEEKVVSCNIFDELVTLRSAEGDTRVVSLADLKVETGETDSALLSTTMEHQVSQADELLDAETVSMLDTQEYEVAVLAAPELLESRQSVRSEQNAEASPEDGPDQASDDGEDEEPVDLAAGHDDEPATIELSTGSGGEHHRKRRRRGRRGGRRLRAAEERKRQRPDSDAGQSGNDGDQSID